MPEPTADSACAAIVLAAGASTRLGRPKQLIRCGEESLLRRVARFAGAAGCEPVFVVLGYRAGELQAELGGLAAEALVNESWAEGMGSSLRCGMEAIIRLQPPPAAVLVLVCDQPALGCEHLRALRASHAEGDWSITASGYAERAGVPAVFSRRLFPELLAVTGDRGARDVILAHEGQARILPWAEGVFDLDTEVDVSRAQLS